MDTINATTKKLQKLPQHIAIIMDGNGRWAQAKKMPREKGHKQGVITTKNIVKHCLKIGIKNLTLFAFSSENNNRPKKEISLLFKMFKHTLITETKKLNDYNIKLRVIGDTTIFDKETRELIDKAQQLSSNNESLNLFIAANYGGRWDIVQATKKIAKMAKDEKVNPTEINEDFFKKHLSLANYPSVDLLIRTSGEVRISNFLLWDIAYSEMFFTNTCWPEFTISDFEKALIDFSSRKRNFGKIIQEDA